MTGTRGQKSSPLPSRSSLSLFHEGTPRDDVVMTVTFSSTMAISKRKLILCAIAICGYASVKRALVSLSAVHHPSPPAASSLPKSVNVGSESSAHRRRLSNALPNGGCEITWPQPPPGAFLIAHVVCRVHCLLLVYFLVILTYLSLSQHTNNLCSIVSRLWSSHDMESRRGFDGSSNRRRLEQQWSW